MTDPLPTPVIPTRTPTTKPSPEIPKSMPSPPVQLRAAYFRVFCLTLGGRFSAQCLRRASRRSKFS